VTRSVFLAVGVLMACAHDQPTSTKHDEPTSAAPGHSEPTVGGTLQITVISNRTEAKAAVGKRVRVHGVAERDKLGDAVTSPGFSVICMAPRLPEARLGQSVEVEGILELTDAFQATTSPSGEISQGTEPGTSSYVINTCTLR
jgi:hypothetical protein